MNYNRRSTRPDSLFYREQRKLRPHLRGRSLNPIVIFVGAVLLGLLMLWIFHKSG
jgi:hypothetical protein